MTTPFLSLLDLRRPDRPPNPVSRALWLIVGGGLVVAVIFMIANCLVR